MGSGKPARLPTSTLAMESIPAANALLLLRLTETKTVEATSTPEAIPGSVAHLTRRLAAGEEEAFREFHKNYFNRLYQFLLVVTRGQEHEAQEALQEDEWGTSERRYVGEETNQPSDEPGTNTEASERRSNPTIREVHIAKANAAKARLEHLKAQFAKAN